MNLKIIFQAGIREISTLTFLLTGIFIVFLTINEPVKDFGNYYYGSKLLIDGKFDIEIYKNIAWFNDQIAGYGETDFFENYIPVPPFNALFYTPFCFLSSLHAKLIFNLCGLFVFCAAFHRLITNLQLQSVWLPLLPLVFLFPLYQNILQGQTYLLVTAGLIFVYLFSEKNKVILPSLILALIISIKIFPAFILLYFLLKRDYKTCLATIFFTVLIFLTTLIFIDPPVTGYYFTNILPRLFNNDIIGPFYPGNQSFYTLLLHLFSYDGLANPSPIANSPMLVTLLESIFGAFILMVLWQLRTGAHFTLYATVITGSVLISRYSTGYGAVFLLLFALSFISIKNNQVIILIILLILFISFYPFNGNFLNSLKYTRLIGITTVFLVFVFYFKTGWNTIVFISLLVPIFTLKLITFPVKKVQYFYIQNTKGILYDLNFTKNGLTLLSTAGSEKTAENFEVNGISTDERLFLMGNVLYYKGHVLDDENDNKRRPFIINDSTVVFMSDLNQGVGFYKLRTIHLAQ